MTITANLRTCLKHVLFCILAISWLQVNRPSALAFLQTRRTTRAYRQHHARCPGIPICHFTLASEFTALRAQAQKSQPTSCGGTASVPTLVISLVKSIVGAGVLALPASIAGLGQDYSSPTLLLPALLVVIAIGCINSYFFSLVGRVCRMTGATSYQDAWDKTMGAENSTGVPKEKSSLVALVVTLKTVLSCLAFSIILADSFQSIAVASGIPDATRGQALAAVTTVLLLPLCTLVKDLTALAPFSFLGLVGVGTTMTSMIFRYLDGSYRVGGEFALPLNIQQHFGNVGSNFSLDNINASGGLVLACTLATAFVAHYNAPRFYNELENNTEKRFDTVVTWSYVISGVAFMIVASAGFLTFGDASGGFILNSYSPFDPLITVSRIALAFSIALTYPLPFFGLRDGVLDLVQVSQKQRNGTYQSVLSIGLLLGVTTAAYFVKDVALVLSVGGGTFSTAISSVIPTLMFRSAVKQQEMNEGDKVGVATQYAFDSQLALVLMWICITIGASGVFIALQNEWR
jgi:amino acid permease